MKNLTIALAFVFALSFNVSYASSDLDALLNEISNITGTNTAPSHNAWEMTLENISYTTDGKDLYTVTWTPLVGSANVKVEIKESKEADYFTLNTVKWADGKIDIKLPTAGQYQVRMTALDSSSNAAISKEYIQTIKVAWVAASPAPVPVNNTTTTTTTSTPTVMDAKTGAWENLVIFSIIMWLMMYSVYRFRKN